MNKHGTQPYNLSTQPDWQDPTLDLHALSLVCRQCGATAPGTSTHFRCACGTPFDLADELILSPRSTMWSGGSAMGPMESPESLRTRFHERLHARGGSARSGVWRYRELVLPLAEKDIISRQEGNTPLYPVGAAERDAWRQVGLYAGAERLYLKHEGANPTGSFKDRGMTVGISVARILGARAVACASTGNTAASLAAYAAQAGLPALVFLPAGKVTSGKLAQSIAYGARLVEIAGDFDDAMRRVEAIADTFGIYLLNSINPYRLAGQRSIAYEILQQLNWQAPDWVVLPAGNLGNTAAIGTALLYAAKVGLIGQVPRIAAVQAARANPFYRSFVTQWQYIAPVRATTRATAINIGAPVSFARAKRVIEATQGVVTEVSDEEIFTAKAYVDRAGIGCEPASAAAIAGVRRLIAEKVIAPQATIVAILTGHLLKDIEAVTQGASQVDTEATTTAELDSIIASLL
jgi:threonine synthase